MAEKGTKAKSGGAKAAAKATPKADEHERHEEGAHEGEGKSEKAAGHASERDAHGHGAGAHAADAHGHAPNYREYFMVFVVLFVLTVLEVAITKVPGINHRLMGLALVGMALTKVSFVGLFYMHLKHETKFLKLTVVLPMAAPTLYALVLISEAAWRLTR